MAQNPDRRRHLWRGTLDALRLEGAPNFRDIGGSVTTMRPALRIGCLFRSDSLGRLTDLDVESLKLLGVKTAIDLRSPKEVTREPSRLSDGVSIILIPMGGTDSDHVTLEDEVLAREVKLITPQDVGESYVRLLETHASEIGIIVKMLSNESNIPAILFCTSGKDRTGIVVALLLGLLGVPSEAIMNDYALTNPLAANQRLEKLRTSLERAGVAVEDVEAGFLAPPAALQTMLDYIERKYGGFAAFAKQRMGISRRAIDAIRGVALRRTI
jgi:protein-tyrosine phosphatase